MGGDIWIESELGVGSKFIFTIPMTDNGSLKVTPEEISNEVAEQSKNIKILIVDDDEISRLYITEVLKNDSITFLHASDGQECINIVKNSTEIDIVLMDIKMPKMDGYQATKIIKDIHPNLIVIAQTANALDHDRQKSLDAGCDNYISKPIKRNELKDIISKYVQNPIINNLKAIIKVCCLFLRFFI